jgi:hypothetical protein
MDRPLKQGGPEKRRNIVEETGVAFPLGTPEPDNPK